jgi:hypothetical protein
MQLIDPNEESMPGDLSSKIVGNARGHGPGFPVHFTVILPQLMAMLQQRLAW